MNAPLPTLESTRVAVIGLGYVGLPLALAFSKCYPTFGFDTNTKRLEQLQQGIDTTAQVETKQIIESSVQFCANLNQIAQANVYIICVPTPIDAYKVPDLSPLLYASELVGKVLQKGNVVIYESTTYPTCTENECKHMLECTSSLQLNADFYLGYSPERINPSDKIHTLENICKITSASTPEAAGFVDSLYASIIPAGTHCVSSIKTAEMVKIIENAQRDLNIAFVNEMCIICDYLEIDALEVLEAAKTKWNFLPFAPGLVGGHCISIDPYYLTHKMNSIGYYPQVISSGRLINDTMPHFIAQKIIKLMIKAQIEILSSRILILGITFKQDCPDIRNSKVPLVKNELEEYGAKVCIYDPIADRQNVQETYGISLLESLPNSAFDAIFLAVGHSAFLNLSHYQLGKQKHIYFSLTHHKLDA